MKTNYFQINNNTKNTFIHSLIFYFILVRVVVVPKLIPCRKTGREAGTLHDTMHTCTVKHTFFISTYPFHLNCHFDPKETPTPTYKIYTQPSVNTHTSTFPCCFDCVPICVHLAFCCNTLNLHKTFMSSYRNPALFSPGVYSLFLVKYTVFSCLHRL